MCEQGGMNVAGTFALESCLSTSLSSTITVKDPAIEVLALLRILYGISKYWDSLYLVCTFYSPFYDFIGPILWGHSCPLCHALSLLLSLSSWTSMRRWRATVAACNSSDTW